MNDLTWKQKALYDLMSDISEDCYCAGWYIDNEYILWKMVSDPSSSRCYGQGEVSESEITMLREISDEIGGWIIWHNESGEEWGARFCPIEDWLERYRSKPG